MNDVNFVNLAHGVNNQNSFFCSTVTRDEIQPFSTTKVFNMAKHVVGKINCTSDVNLNFGYAKGSLSKNKKKKLNILLRDHDQHVDLTTMIKWVSLLI